MQDLKHKNSFKTWSKYTKKKDVLMFQIEKTHYHKDINSSYVNLKFNVIMPIKILSLHLFLLEKLYIKYKKISKQYKIHMAK